MKRPIEIIQPLDSFSASSLISTSPTFVQANEAEPTIITTLSPAGQEFIFAHGQAAIISKLLDDCVAPTDRGRAARIRWHFADPNVKVTNRTEPITRPVLPDVIGRDTQGTKRVLYLYVPDTLAWFDGHFPGDPILPAVVQIDWVIHFGACSGLDRNHFSGLHRLKFFSVIEPKTILRLTIDTSREGLQFILESHAGLHSKGTIHFHHSDDQR